jgi:hypothetical protein
MYFDVEMLHYGFWAQYARFIGCEISWPVTNPSIFLLKVQSGDYSSKHGDNAKEVEYSNTTLHAISMVTCITSFIRQALDIGE